LNDQYGSACIRLLIPRLSDESYVSHDETLLATPVLATPVLATCRIYADTLENEGAHLSGAFSLIASQKQLPTQDSLPGAALWTYMRQYVCQALLARASPKLTPRYGIRLDTLTSVDEHACHMAAMACTFAWGGEGGEVDADQVELMLEVWLENLPGEYHPFFASGKSFGILPHGMVCSHLALGLVTLTGTSGRVAILPSRKSAVEIIQFQMPSGCRRRDFQLSGRGMYSPKLSQPALTRTNGNFASR
jgi:hypothetical protein